MSWDDSLSDLLNLFVRLYPDPIIARNVAERAGLQTRYLRIGSDPDSVWMAVLGQARDTPSGLEALGIQAQKDFPSIDFVSIARQVKGRNFKGPLLDEPSWKGTTSVDEGLEKIIGAQPTFLPISFLEVGLEMARAVTRVVCPTGLGTGFLTRDNILITNNHVISSVSEAKEAKLQFNYQDTARGHSRQVAEFALVPEEGFATSPMKGGDDWTAVRVKGNPNQEWGMLRIADSITSRVHDPLGTAL